MIKHSNALSCVTLSIHCILRLLVIVIAALSTYCLFFGLHVIQIETLQKLI